MSRRLFSSLVSVGAAAVLAAALAGCTSSADSAVSASPSSTPTASASSAPVSAPSAEPSANASQTPAPEGTCPTDGLDITVVDGGGGAAGSVDLALQFTNTTDAECLLDGPPGVSFVGDGNGTQIGAPATQTGAGEPVTIAAGGSAYAPLKVANAQNYDAADCTPVTADGYRVYPPHSYTSVFVKASGMTACENPDAALLSVGPVQSEHP
ncbi:uncharacterized protein DUF4232 [Labedella gwakjiensis]|uniref:DUF4232 domain-containing protein n=1 Tax=Labedella gwakjiensis TaxID=390269 RepID=A0A2P8GTK0_9MICO|nr:DUF4232 domain-containing protein [Labedella gwakjiensis]PSL37290.1 uncharacterized protein DUF4232 [Labedella gwakjiensis]RUQ84616.1 DUF4232 domain-containing protein [Labedella gwakjiensis]